MIFNSGPYNFAFDYNVTMCDNISETDYSSVISDIFNKLGINGFDTIQSLTDYFKFSFDSGLKQSTALKCTEIRILYKIFNIFGSFSDVKKMFFLFHAS